MASRVVLSVVEEACNVLDTLQMDVAECKNTRTTVQILDLLNGAKMAFESGQYVESRYCSGRGTR